MTNSNQAIAQYFSQGDKAIATVLQHCNFFPIQDEAGHLVIHCPYKLFGAVMNHVETINWQSSRALVKTIDFYSFRDGIATHEATLIPGERLCSVGRKGVDALGLSLLLKLGVNFEHPLAIVEMGTNRGVFCSKGIIQQSKAGNVDNWIDHDMGKFHYPEGLKILESAYDSGIANAVEWTAKTFQGDPLEIAANVYAGELNGVPVRVTENLHWQIV